MTDPPAWQADDSSVGRAAGWIQSLDLLAGSQGIGMAVAKDSLKVGQQLLEQPQWAADLRARALHGAN